MVTALSQLHHGVQQAWDVGPFVEKSEILFQNGSIILLLNGSQLNLHMILIIIILIVIILILIIIII